MNLNANPLGLDVSSNPYGQDTKELLRRIANIQDGRLDVSRLNITSLPELPSGLQDLWCEHSPLRSLPELPAKLKELWCWNTQLTSLPSLPSSLEVLRCNDTPLKTLPNLPPNLRVLLCYRTQLASLPNLPDRLTCLDIYRTQITILPELPTGLNDLSCSNTPLIIQQNFGETLQAYNLRWRAWREEQASKKRSQERCSLLKEDIIAEVWHPRRVEKLLETGGYELLESF